MNKGWIDGREVHVKETNTLVRLMNAGKFPFFLSKCLSLALTLFHAVKCRIISCAENHVYERT